MAEIMFQNVEDDSEIVNLLTQYLCAFLIEMEKLSLYMFEGISTDYRCRDMWICRLIFMYMCLLQIFPKKLVHFICHGILFKYFSCCRLLFLGTLSVSLAVFWTTSMCYFHYYSILSKGTEMLLPILAYACVVRFLTSVQYSMMLRMFKYVLTLSKPQGMVMAQIS